MIRVLTLISLPLIVDSINDLAWYSPNTRSVPSSILSDVSLKASVDLCHLPPDVGGCTKELIRYYYDPKSDECKRFIFSGCGGNSNRFMRRTHCRSRCVQKKDKAEMALNLAKESKHRRTVTTAPLTSTTAATTKATTMKPTTTSTIRAPPASTRPIQMISKTKITPSIRECPHCDPIYGICAEAGDCGCIPGFKKLGRICIDINECDSENICPQNSRCVNTIGSHRCDCDSGFTDNGECQITKDACTDVFDINLTEEDCNNGEQLIRYYFDHESMRCKQFFYGGCKSTSRNIFSDIQTCDDLCASVPREALKVLSFGNIVAQNEVITPYPMKLNLEISEDIQTTTLSTQQQKTEADKIVKIMQEVNPNDNTCLRDFDEVLRLECVSAEWDEKFYWNYEKRECEPFWYDTSCDARDTAGKNFFESLEVCQKTCHEDVDSSEPMKDRSPPKKTLELPSFHPSIEEEGQRILESAQIEERHPLADLHEKYKLLKTFEVAPQTTQSPTEVSTPIVSESEEQRELTMNLQRNLAINKGTDTEIKQEVEEDVEYEEVTAPPVYRHPLEDIPIDEEEQPKKIRKMRKKVNSLSSSAGIEQVESQMKNTFELPSVPSRAPESPTTSQTATTMTEITETEATTTSTSTTTTTTTTTTQAITPSSQKVVETTPFVKIITLPTHVRLAPGPRMDPSTFATKSTPLSTFNREQYMLEFKKKLMSLPNGSPSSSSEEQPTFVLKPSASPRRPLFTLPPSVFEEATTTDSNIATTHRHRSHYSHRRDSNDIYSTSKDLPTTPEPDFITKEKTKVVKTLNELGKLADLCEEPLHPRLEEDCSNENWVIRWYFNTDKGACKSFWYGGCDSDARNFFSTVYSCKTACAHKYPVGEQQIHVPGAVVTTTVSVQSDHERAITDPEVPSESQHTFSDEEHEQVHVLPTDHPVKYYDISPDLLEKPKSEPDQATSNHVNETPQLEEHQQFSSENLKTNFESKDFCDDGYDEKWDEDCSNDDWKVRSYYDSKKKGCKKFWWGGCLTSNRNLWKDQQECMEKCGHKMKTNSENSGTSIVLMPDSRSSFSVSYSDVPRNSNSLNHHRHQHHHHHHHSSHSHNHHHHHHTRRDSSREVSDSSSFAPHHALPLTQSQSSASSESSTLRQPRAQQKKFHIKGLQVRMTETHYQKGIRRTRQPASEDVVGTKDEQSDVAVEEQPSTGIDQVSTTTMTAKDLEHKNLVAQHAFQADLSRQMASIQRAEENRADLAYSKAVDHPVTVASECLERFDKNLEKSCSGGHLWKNRFYYDPDTRQCKMYWNDGCFSTSRNNFDDIESCLWKCAGKHPEVKGRGCLEKFDTVYLGDCRLGEFSTRFYFDHEKKRCVAFHWGGCRSPSLNFFTDSGECEEVCERPPRELTQACIQPFDDSYKDSCSATGRFQQFYYFDHSTHRCQMFWYGNCKGENENIFPSLETCQWICERHIEERTPNHCAARFDPKYQESCGNGEWQEKWHFEPKTGECNSFWWDGCVSNSENIFPSEESCKRHCVHPGYAVESRLPDPETKYRCLEPIEIGNCRETYPAFYYDKTSKVCRPFAYSGCDGNGNRFMTLSQCEGLCYEFNDMTEPEMDCHQPLHIGYGKNDDHCLAQASYRFYYDREYGKCSQFWYLGCGGNANNFHSYEVCQRTCQVERRKLERKPRANSHVCSQPGSSSGKCSSSTKRPVQRWSYHNKKCVSFTYSGCGGNENRFATEWECSEICRGIKPSNDPAICSHPPDWGKCNQLEYMWFFNETRGTCDQFLYGGCGGNTNKFESFEKCQKTCEISGLDPCLESLDRGNWCEAMSNRYYFNKRSKACRGFHYTGCGKSANNFMTLHECKSKCEARHGKSKREDQRLPQHVNNWNSHYNYSDNIRFPRQKSSKKKQQTGYSGVKPKVKTPMHKHIILQGNNLTYFKSEPIWYDYSLCLGYRYNISGRDTILNVHLCSLDGAGDCFSQTLMPTESEEFCEVTRPFLRGTHLYSWYFGLDEKPKSYNDNSPKERKNQRPEETYASILLLKANHCHNIC